MKRILFFTFVFSLLFSFELKAQDKMVLFPSKVNKMLEKENKALQRKLDSLQNIIDSLFQQGTPVDSLSALDAEEDALQLLEGQYTLEATDSLLNVWYSNRSGDFNIFDEYNPESAHYSSNVSDEVMIQRLKDMNSFITLPFNETVKNYMILYSEKMKDRMGRLLGFGNYYFPILEETLARYKMPLELKYMAVIESFLNPTATSRAGARGMWQFMYRTAKLYGLEIDSFVDERLDVEKSADAAARYMLDAYRIFGDWCLAISSYNCGSGNVLKAIRRAGGSRDFWTIYPFLPRETRGYMPAFVGAMYAITYYKEYGIMPKDVGMPAKLDTLEVTRRIHFKQIQEVIGFPVEDLEKFNPEYIHDIIPGTTSRRCAIRIPYNWTSAFMNFSQDSVANYKIEELVPEILKGEDAPEPKCITYKVRSGDYLGRIATKYGVTVAQLKSWNGLKSNTLRIGQILYVYPSGYVAPKKSSSQNTSSGASQKTSGNRTYVVKSGDSLYNIAKKYPGVSVQDIMNLNNLKSSKLMVGQKLKIPSD